MYTRTFTRRWVPFVRPETDAPAGHESPEVIASNGMRRFRGSHALIVAALAALALRCSLVSLDGLSGGALEVDAGSDAFVADAGAADADADASDARPCPPDETLATDPENCGRCGHDCLGGSCQGGVCQALAVVTDAGQATYLRLDDDYVYYVDDGAREVRRVPKRGGPIQVLTAGQPELFQLAVDGAHVYFTADGVRRVPKSGGGVQIVSSREAAEVTIDDDSVYFTNYSSDGGGAAYRSAKDGTSPLLLASDLSFCESILSSNGVVFFGGSRIGTVAKTGGPVSTIAGSGARRMALDATHVFAIGYSSTAVKRFARDGSEMKTVAVSPGEFNASDIALDADFVYWTVNSAAGYVVRAPKGGGALDLLAGPVSSPWGVAVDERAVYWSLPSSGTIMKRAK